MTLANAGWLSGSPPYTILAVPGKSTLLLIPVYLCVRSTFQSHMQGSCGINYWDELLQKATDSTILQVNTSFNQSPDPTDVWSCSSSVSFQSVGRFGEPCPFAPPDPFRLHREDYGLESGSYVGYVYVPVNLHEAWRYLQGWPVDDEEFTLEPRSEHANPAQLVFQYL